MRAPEEPEANPYAVSMDALERGSRVLPEDQVGGVPDTSDKGSDSAWDEAQRQLRLAGGA